MLPVVDRPVIELAVDEARRSGITNVTLITSPGKELLLRHFQAAPDLERYLEERDKADLLQRVRAVVGGLELDAVTQEQPLGLGHPVLQAQAPMGAHCFGCQLPA